jgi:hypothetical protein
VLFISFLFSFWLLNFVGDHGYLRVALLSFTNLDHLTFDPQNVRLEAKKKLPTKKLAGKSSLRANQTKGKRLGFAMILARFISQNQSQNFVRHASPSISLSQSKILP